MNAETKDTRLLRRCLRREDVEAIFGIKPSTFSRWVSIGIMPPTITGTRFWDRVAIESALSNMSGREKQAANDNVSTADQWFKENSRAGRS